MDGYSRCCYLCLRFAAKQPVLYFFCLLILQLLLCKLALWLRLRIPGKV